MKKRHLQQNSPVKFFSSEAASSCYTHFPHNSQQIQKKARKSSLGPIWPNPCGTRDLWVSTMLLFIKVDMWGYFFKHQEGFMPKKGKTK